ncbi:MAG: hypothetical protein ICV83_33030 [Cytophagales bacterium]|nr:hypothetical protein [Cytophagales bacterium]
MKPFLCLSLFAFLLASSCRQQEQEPAAKIPAPPPPSIISNNNGTGTPTITSSITGAKIIVDAPNENGAVVYADQSGCSGVRFQARSFGSPSSVQVSGSTCPGSPTNVTKVVYPTSSWQSYDLGIVQFPGGGLIVMAQANSTGSYGGVEVINIVWS